MAIEMSQSVKARSYKLGAVTIGDLNEGDILRVNGRDSLLKVVEIDEPYIDVRSKASSVGATRTLKAHHDGSWRDLYDGRKCRVERVSVSAR